MIVISEVMDPQGLTLLEGLDVHYDPQLYSQRRELLQWTRDAEALIVRNQTQVNQELIESATGLKAVGRLGVGLDNLDMPRLAQRQIPVIVPRGANAISVAEYVLASLMSFRRHLPALGEQVRSGQWVRDMSGTEIAGTCLALVGFGATGKALAYRAEALGLRLKVYDPLATDVPARWAASSLTELFVDADAVSLHVPLTAQTRHLINAYSLRDLAAHAVLINTARGELVDETALLDALIAGELGGALLDVRESEPPVSGDALTALANVWTTPHIAGLTQNSQVAIARTVSEGIKQCLAG
jgi:phosphoglycerate dehydrogenase-like enzyme